MFPVSRPSISRLRRRLKTILRTVLADLAEAIYRSAKATIRSASCVMSAHTASTHSVREGVKSLIAGSYFVTLLFSYTSRLPFKATFVTNTRFIRLRAQATTIGCGSVFRARVTRANGRFVFRNPPRRLFFFIEIGRFVPPKKFSVGHFTPVVQVCCDSFYGPQLLRSQALLSQVERSASQGRSFSRPQPIVVA